MANRQPKVQTTQRTYKSKGAMQRGIAHMTRAGWRVVSTVENRRKTGVLRILMLGIFAFGRGSEFIVTYQR